MKLEKLTELKDQIFEVTSVSKSQTVLNSAMFCRNSKIMTSGCVADFYISDPQFQSAYQPKIGDKFSISGQVENKSFKTTKIEPIQTK